MTEDEFERMEVLGNSQCQHCKDWGRTIEDAERIFHPEIVYIPCPQCNRYTWPNSGVNMPAGAVWCHTMNGQARRTAADLLRPKHIPKLDKFDKREIFENERRKREEASGLRSGDSHNRGGLPSIVATPVRKQHGRRI